MSGFTKRRLRVFLLGARDGAQQAIDETPRAHKYRIARLLGRRDAFEELMDALDDDIIEQTAAEQAGNAAGSPGDGES